MFNEAAIPPGPNAGRVWRDRAALFRDRISGRLVRQLTAYRGHSHHKIGTAPCWLDGGRRLIIASDREGCGNFFAYDFNDSTLTQLTDLRGAAQPVDARVVANTRLRFLYENTNYDLELTTLRMSKPIRSRSPSRRLPVPQKRIVVGATAIARARLIWCAAACEREQRIVAFVTGTGTGPYAEPAPCLSPQGDRVVFTANADGYAQVYAVELGDITTLPRL